MIGTIVDYLHRARVPFHLASYPSEEALPIAAHPTPPGGLVVDARMFLVNGRAVIVVFPASEEVDLSAISASLGGVVVSGTNEELPAEFRRTEGPIPPLGQLFGMPIIADERISQAAILVFRAFGESVYFEIPYEDYARLEQPRLASFASAGELGIGASSS
jgi:Ala-tRNA(Pro) deacylase